ncbi:hypothetical protein F8O01_14025 [Pseudoclavibacter chungangensis]|uniref:Uncharacterized protein n=1 Tax=Pseudoclavibacter chungangensis TaxID=587635 RepID=A0A7J5BQQ1_9MICO|nr:hypothetical protein [Pseudoclavibacter chungangensis]KAB1654031.1 hypothetical protein F8O01_14025 [Pseudoclavibacter chungangensis]NYJ66062.1 peptidoglycan/LPS O-acetylase OafA/YrhL [Pseudoclavibacter chungangensis]
MTERCASGDAEPTGSDSTRPWWAIAPLGIVGLVFLATACMLWLTNDTPATALPFWVLGLVFLVSGGRRGTTDDADEVRTESPTEGPR